MNNFDILKEMSNRNMDIRMAPLDNITNLQKTRAGTQVTIGVAGYVVAAIGIEGRFVGGLILADRKQFEQVKTELGMLPVARSREEINEEVKQLHPIAKDYDTELQSNDTCLACGAHDALRWALGLAEGSISEYLRKEE